MNQPDNTPDWQDVSVHDNSGAFIGEVVMCGHEEIISMFLSGGTELVYQLKEVIKHQQFQPTQSTEREPKKRFIAAVYNETGEEPIFLGEIGYQPQSIHKALTLVDEEGRKHNYLLLP
jgi:hypothetical protein